MKLFFHKLPSALLAGSLVSGTLSALPHASAQTMQHPSWHLNVDTKTPGPTINPSFYGLMTEEISHAYDGGLYAELIRNRSFRDDQDTPVHWFLLQDPATDSNASMALDKTGGVNSTLNVSLKVTVAKPGTRVGVANEGFWGIPVSPQTSYRASFYAKADAGFSGPLEVAIESNDGKTVFAHAQVTQLTSDWKKYSVQLKTGNVKASLTNRLVISTRKPGQFWLSFVSLFPPTYHNRANGNRIDLMEKLAELHPTFLRFPGGNYLDPGHFEWKKTIGPLEQRPLGPGAWGYSSSYGLGILEFLEWCEDLKMEPLLAVSDGRGWLAGNADVSPLVQDALDEIEYVTGAPDTPWGAKRAADGHPAPFKLRYVEIGNEDFFDDFDTYNARFAKFYDAIRAKYPNLQLIGTRQGITSRRPDLVDDHLYSSVSGMLRASKNYDNYDRNYPPVFVGEWATQSGVPTPNLRGALADAVYLTGLERNADVVKMASYAPLLVNVNPDASQWATNLIGYDAQTSFGSPSYYMQAMFSRNKGDVVLPIKLSQPDALPLPPRVPQGMVGVGTWSTQAEFKEAQVTQEGAPPFKSDLNDLREADAGTGTGDAPAVDANTDEVKQLSGSWQVKDGNLMQSSEQDPSLAVTGSPNWTNYSYTVKARKLSGQEGFLIVFHYKDPNNYSWWNLGGWGNTRSSFERAVEGEKAEFGSSDTTIETGRWYDIRIDVQGDHVRGYLDGQLVVEAQEPPIIPVSSFYGGATRDLKTGDIIFKVINMADFAQQVQFDVQGEPRLGRRAEGQVLTGPADAVNSVETPQKVVPQAFNIENVGPQFTSTFPANSVSVFRVKTH